MKYDTYREVNIDQSGDQWLDWRREGWGSSESAVIMQVAPSYRDNTWEGLRLAREGKVELDEKTKKLFAYGHEQEPLARDWFNQSFEKNLQPICVENLTEPRLRASLDGYRRYSDGMVEVLEIKSPQRQSRWYRDVDSFETLPEYYQWQLIHQFGALGLDTVIFHYVIWLGGEDSIWFSHEMSIIDYGRDVSKLVSQWLAFERGAEPGVCTNEWIAAADKWKDAKERYDNASRDLADARDALLELRYEDDFINYLDFDYGAGVRIREYEKKGAVNKRAMEDAGEVCICDQYRYPPTRVRSIVRQKG